MLFGLRFNVSEYSINRIQFQFQPAGVGPVERDGL
jgi:hypothetical protein